MIRVHIPVEGHRPDPGRLRELRAELESLDSAPGVDLNLEARVLHELLGSQVSYWPTLVSRITFNPSVRIDDAVAIVDMVLPGWSWSVSGPSSTRQVASVTPPGPFRPITITSRGRRAPAASLLSAALEAVAREFETE